MPETWSCGTCGGSPAGKEIRKDGFRFRVCAECGSASLEPLPTEEEAAGLYGDRYFEGGTQGGYEDYAADSTLHCRNARSRLRTIDGRRREKPGSLLDIGCAAGFFLEEARRTGWSIAGMDVSSWARDQAGGLLGVEVYPDLEPLQRECAESFDVVCLGQVLEHAVRPLQMLRAAQRCLRPGGLLFIETWDRESPAARLFGNQWQQITPPSVIHLFSRRGLVELLARAGFQSPRFKLATKFVSVRFVGGLLARKYPRLEGLLGRPTRSGPLSHLALPYFFGDLIHVTSLRGLDGNDQQIDTE